jgi:hypothetical protein
MPLPVIAITNVSTCLIDAQVEAVLPALQKQVSEDFKAYWEQDCTLSFYRKTSRSPADGGRSSSPIIPTRPARSDITR